MLRFDGIRGKGLVAVLSGDHSRLDRLNGWPKSTWGEDERAG